METHRLSIQKMFVCFHHPHFTCGHVLNILRQGFSICLWEEVSSNCRQNSQSPQHNVRQVLEIYLCTKERESYSVVHCPLHDAGKTSITTDFTH